MAIAWYGAWQFFRFLLPCYGTSYIQSAFHAEILGFHISWCLCCLVDRDAHILRRHGIH
jgi:hypothetical protein